jgi:hypothetical protein
VPILIYIFGRATKDKMATVKFNTQLEALFTGLIKDALHDDTYEHARNCYQAYITRADEVAEDYFQRKFIEWIRQGVNVRQCLHYKETTTLQSLLEKECPAEVSGDLKEIFMALDNPLLFKADTIKKGWKRIQKLVYTCNLQKVVTGSDIPEEDDEEKIKRKRKGVKEKEDSTKEAAEGRIQRFNSVYRSFLAQLTQAFPGGEVDVVVLFDDTVAADHGCVCQQFKEYILPFVPKFAEAIQEQQKSGDTSKDASEKVFAQYFGDDPSWFKGLPFVDQLPIDVYWAEQIANEQNKLVIMKGIGDLVTCMSGLDTIIYSPIVKVIKEKAVVIMKRDNLTTADFNPTSPSFSRTKMINLAMELVHVIPEATGYKISSEDITTLITNVMSGKDDYPESFNEVFSPAMLDMDVLECVGDLPMLGDALGPVLAGAQGVLKGHTGTPAFGSVQKPAWIDRD